MTINLRGAVRVGACFGGTCGRVRHLRLRSRPPVHSLTTLALHLTKQLYNFKKKKQCKSKRWLLPTELSTILVLRKFLFILWFIFVLVQARIAQKISECLKREGGGRKREEGGHRESYLGQRAAGSRSKRRRWMISLSSVCHGQRGTPSPRSVRQRLHLSSHDDSLRCNSQPATCG